MIKEKWSPREKKRKEKNRKKKGARTVNNEGKFKSSNVVSKESSLRRGVSRLWCVLHQL